MIVKYSKKFNTGPWLNEDIGFEIQAAGDSRDEAISALSFLKSIAEQFHKENNPQLEYGEITKLQVGEYPPYQSTMPTIQSVDYKAKERLEILIDNSNTVEELSCYYEDASRMGLFELYTTKLQSLQK